MAVDTDPVCLALDRAIGALAALEADALTSLTDLDTIAAIVKLADRVEGLTHRIHIHALADLGATLPRVGRTA